MKNTLRSKNLTLVATGIPAPFCNPKTKTTSSLKSFFTLVVMVLGMGVSWGQTPYVMSGGDYSEAFTNIANATNWPNAFNGTDCAEWKSVSIATGVSLGDGIKTTTSTAAFTTSSTGGVQRGTANIQLLSSSTNNSCAIDLLLNFTGRNAGTISFDVATVFNSSGNRNSILKLFYSTNGTTFTEITGTNLPYTASNNVTGSASIVTIALPSAFNNSATAVLRFYEYSTTAASGSATGSQPKISIDNIAVTSTAAGNTSPTAPLAPTSIAITAGNTQLSVDFTAGGDGGSAITNYKYSIDDGINFVACSPSQTTSPIVITGLTNGTTYQVQIKAVNNVGDGTATASSAATPLRTSLTTDYYRSRTTGNWGTAATWESSPDAITWGTATLAPTASANTITILNSHNVTVAASVTADQLVIEEGATLTNSAGLTIANGTGTDLAVSGTLTNSSSFSISASANVIVNGTLTQTVSTAITTSGSLEFTATGIYNHQINSGTIPTASWKAASTCNVTNITNGIPSGLGQTFGNFIWNCPTQSTFIPINNSSFGTLGVFRIISTNGLSNNLTLASTVTGTYNYSFNSIIIEGGHLAIAFTSGVTVNASVVNDLSVSSGKLTINGSAGVGNLSIQRDLLLSGSSNLVVLNASSSPTANILVGRDLNISDSAFIDLESVNATSSSGTITVTRNFNSTGSGSSGVVIDFGGSTATGVVAGNSIVIGGNFLKSGAGYFETTSEYSATGFVFNGSGIQTFEYSGTSSYYTSYVINSGSIVKLLSDLTIGSALNPRSDFTLNGTLDFQNFSIIADNSTDPRFIATSGATLISSNTNGFGGTTSLGSLKGFGTLSTTQSNGRITLPDGLNYIFNGNTTTPYPTGTFGNPASLTFNANVVSNRTSSLSVSGAITINNGARYSFNPANATDGFTLPGTLTIAAGGTFDSAGENNISNSGGTGSVVVSGTFITRDAQGLKGSSTTLPSVSLTLNAGSTVDYGGTNQTITSISNYKNVTFSGAGPFIVQPNTIFSFNETADFGGKSIIFKSDTNGTASLGKVTGTLTGATNVTVERYIPFGKRAFRFLTPSVTTTTSSIYTNWQNGGAVTAGRGTHITGSTSGANGFDVTASGNPSMFTYENNVASGTGWLAIPNTNATALTAGMGYRTLVRGDRNVNISVASTDNMNVATTLSATGTLKVGNVDFDGTTTPALNSSANTTTNGYSLIGNPYASPVDWELVTKSNVEDSYYAWDPNMGTAAERGRYVAYSASTHQATNSGSGTSSVSQFIQPGQAFFVKTIGASPSLTFKEADKASTFTNVFRTIGNSSLSVSVYNPSEVAFASPIDATIAVFATDFDASVGLGDVEKLYSSGEHLAWSRGTKLLAMDATTPVVTSDELLLKTLQFSANKSYTFKVNTTNFDSSLTGYLVDQYLNSQTLLDFSTSNFITFATTTDAASYGADRFKVVFNSSALNNEEWNTKSLRIYPNPVVDNQFTIAVSPSITDKVTICIYNMIGQSVYRESATAINNSIVVHPSAILKAGVYMVEMTNNGKTSTQKIIIK